MTDTRPTVAPVAGKDAMTRDGRRKAVVQELCGDEVNGGFVRDLCFTVWSICHNPTHEDGNADWGSDTLPTVQAGVAKIRAIIEPEAAETPEVGAVTVKPLKWVGGPISQKATCIIGIYSIGRDRVDGLYRWMLLSDNVPASKGTGTNEQSAKAAAQFDYEARILSTLQPSPSSEITRLREVNAGLVEALRTYQAAATACLSEGGTNPSDKPGNWWRKIVDAQRAGAAALRAAEAGE